MKITQQEPIYDAMKLGKGRMAILGLQHMFAMFGATILVPILIGSFFRDAVGEAGTDERVAARAVGREDDRRRIEEPRPVLHREA